MHRLFWCGAVGTVAVAAGLYAAADYVCQNPQSVASRCAVAAYRLGSEHNPVYQLGRSFGTRTLTSGIVTAGAAPDRPCGPATQPAQQGLVVKVQETETGSLLLGASCNSGYGLTGSVVLNECNYDVADSRSACGQTRDDDPAADNHCDETDTAVADEDQGNECPHETCHDYANDPPADCHTPEYDDVTVEKTEGGCTRGTCPGHSYSIGQPYSAQADDTADTTVPGGTDECEDSPRTMPRCPDDETEVPATMPYVEDGEDVTNQELMEFWKNLFEAIDKDKEATAAEAKGEAGATEESEAPTGYDETPTEEMPAEDYHHHHGNSSPGCVYCPYTGRCYPTEPEPKTETETSPGDSLQTTPAISEESEPKETKQTKKCKKCKKAKANEASEPAPSETGTTTESEPATPETGYEQETPEEETPAEDYHHQHGNYSTPGCVCPYTGRFYPAEPEPKMDQSPGDSLQTTPSVSEESEPKQPVKSKKAKKAKKAKTSQLDKGSEDTPVHPEVDTMEFRDCDANEGDFDPKPM